MENSAAKDSVRKSGTDFLSAKERGRIGYGLASVSAIAKRYSGEAEFMFDDDKGVFICTVLMIAGGDS